ncbi:MAG: hypothetical protein KAG66_00525 [Methylococcales bacterium]|nr:hypothetical protein [Methylococcales bacterium]
MAVATPLKVVRTAGDTSGLSEFNPGDTISQSHLPAVEAMGGVLQPDFDDHVDDTDNPHQLDPSSIGAAAQADFLAHQGVNNPHSVTPAIIGAVPTSTKAVPNGVASLDAAGKIPALQIPAVALPQMHVVADTAARQGLTVQEGDEAKQIDDGSHWIYDGSVWHQYPRPIFGDGFSFVNEFAVTTNPTTIWEPKATLLFPMVAGHTVRWGWNYMWNYDSTTSDFRARIMVNGAEYLQHQQEPKDTGGGFGSTGTDQKQPAAGFDYFTATSTGQVTIQIQYRSSATNVEASMWECRLEQWRVA